MRRVPDQTLRPVAGRFTLSGIPILVCQAQQLQALLISPEKDSPAIPVKRWRVAVEQRSPNVGVKLR
jgi:hypothetical protein